MNIERAIKDKMIEQFSPTYIEIENESHKHSSGLGGESHFRVIVVSESFEGVQRVQRQRLVHTLLKSELDGPIHALSLRLLTPAEYKTQAMGLFKSPDCQSKKPL